MSWLEVLRALPEEAVFVAHNPPTPRYGRAQAKLRYVLRTASVLGGRRSDLVEHAIETAAWSPPPTGRGNGYYVCFRLFFDQFERVEQAVLYCFYDGTDGSPGFKTLHEAGEYARLNGFGAGHDEHH